MYYQSTSCLPWGKTQTEAVWEQGAERNIWSSMEVREGLKQCSFICQNCLLLCVGWHIPSDVSKYNAASSSGWLNLIFGGRWSDWVGNCANYIRRIQGFCLSNQILHPAIRSTQFPFPVTSTSIEATLKIRAQCSAGTSS